VVKKIVAKNLIDILIEQAQEREKYFQNYSFYTKEIKKVAEELLGKVKVFVFGSILRKKEVARDIDILIISQKLKTTSQKSKILAKLWEKFGFNTPFEFHLINPDEYKNWYRYFIKEKIEIK
jgi:predicted nucleotidyltransferase